MTATAPVVNEAFGRARNRAFGAAVGHRRAPGGRQRLVDSLRTMAGDPAEGKGGLAQLVVTVLLLFPAWLGLVVADLVVPNTTGSSGSTAVLSVLAGQLAVGVAGVSVLRAWAARELAPVLAAAGFLAYGLNKLLATAGDPGTRTVPQAIGSTSLVVAFGLLLIAMMHRPRSSRTRHPMSVWAGFLAAGLLALAMTNPRGIGILTSSGSGGTVGNFIVVAAWTALAWAAIYAGRREGDQMKVWIGFTAICLAQGRLAFMIIQDHGLSTVASSLLQTIAIALMLFGSIRTVQEMIATHQGRLRETILAFEGSEARRRQEADAHEEAVHNLRSALTTIGSATHLLLVGTKRPLSEAERMSLTSSLEAELGRAQRLLRHEWDGGLVRFPLLDVLTPIVVNEQAQGADIRVLVPAGTHVVGNPDRAYEVFATLFDNARKHARGSQVSVRVIADGESVTVAVEDWGPGLPPAAQDQIFERGWSTSARCDGLGLGLYVARTLMRDQEGDLTADNRPDGGAQFLVRFAAGDAMLASTPPAEDSVG